MYKCPPVSLTAMYKLRQNNNYRIGHIEIMKLYSEIREYIGVIIIIVITIIRKLLVYPIAVV